MNIAMNVVFIGGGNMADALIGGLLKSGFKANQLRAVEIDGAARRRLSDKYRVECVAEVRGTTLEAIAALTTSNFHRLMR